MASPPMGDTTKKKDKNFIEIFKLMNLKNPKPTGLPYKTCTTEEVREKNTYDLQELFDSPPVLNEYNIGIYTTNSWGKLANTVLSEHKNLCKYLGKSCERCKKKNLKVQDKALDVSHNIYIDEDKNNFPFFYK